MHSQAQIRSRRMNRVEEIRSQAKAEGNGSIITLEFPTQMVAIKLLALHLDLLLFALYVNRHRNNIFSRLL